MILEVGEEATFQVDARLEWNASGIGLEANGRYWIEVTHTTEEWRDAGLASSLSKGWNPPARWIDWFVRRRARARRLPMYSLVGSIDENSNTFFLIGDSVSLTAPAAGQLQAFANDWPGRYANNKGRLRLIVRRLDPA